MVQAPSEISRALKPVLQARPKEECGVPGCRAAVLARAPDADPVRRRLVHDRRDDEAERVLGTSEDLQLVDVDRQCNVGDSLRMGVSRRRELARR